MNIAIPAIIITLLLIPGIIARNTFYKEGWHRPIQEGSIFDMIIQGSLVAIPVHWLLLNIVDYWWGISVDTKSFLIALFNTWGKDSQYLDNVVASLENSAENMIVYFFASIIFAYICGIVIYLIIRKARLDIYIKPLRYSNYLIYYFRGDSIFFPSNYEQKLMIEHLLKKEFLVYHLKELFENLDTTFLNQFTHNEWKVTLNFLERFLGINGSTKVAVDWLVRQICRVHSQSENEIRTIIDNQLLPKIKKFNVNKELHKLITRVDVDIDINNETYLFQGYVHDVYFDNVGNLIKIELEYTSKRKYMEQENESVFVNIPGNYFCIKAEHVKTINFTYFPEKVFEYRLALIN